MYKHQLMSTVRQKEDKQKVNKDRNHWEVFWNWFLNKVNHF